MTMLQRITSALWGTLIIVIAIIIIITPGDDTYYFILTFLAIGMLAIGIGKLYYYFSMARYMVGGKVSLYEGVILIDAAVFSISLSDVPKIYLLLYLAIVHAFSGLVEILRSRESISYKAKGWFRKLIHGLVNIALALGCIIFIKRANTASFIYAVGLLYSGIIKIITAFRKSTLVYIQ